MAAVSVHCAHVQVVKCCRCRASLALHRGQASTNPCARTAPPPLCRKV